MKQYTNHCRRMPAVMLFMKSCSLSYTSISLEPVLYLHLIHVCCILAHLIRRCIKTLPDIYSPHSHYNMAQAFDRKPEGSQYGFGRSRRCSVIDLQAFSWEETPDKGAAQSGEPALSAPGWGHSGLSLKYDCGPFTCHVWAMTQSWHREDELLASPHNCQCVSSFFTLFFTLSLWLFFCHSLSFFYLLWPAFFLSLFLSLCLSLCLSLIRVYKGGVADCCGAPLIL